MRRKGEEGVTQLGVMNCLRDDSASGQGEGERDSKKEQVKRRSRLAFCGRRSHRGHGSLQPHTENQDQRTPSVSNDIAQGSGTPNVSLLV